MTHRTPGTSRRARTVALSLAVVLVGAPWLAHLHLTAEPHTEPGRAHHHHGHGHRHDRDQDHDPTPAPHFSSDHRVEAAMVRPPSRVVPVDLAPAGRVEDEPAVAPLAVGFVRSLRDAAPPPPDRSPASRPRAPPVV